MTEQRYYFYRPAIDRHLLDNAISAVELLRTWPGTLFSSERLPLWQLRTSHAEFEDHTSGIMITSTMRMDKNNPKANGLVMRPSESVLIHPERWYYYPLNVHDDSHKAAVDELVRLVENNKGYDKLYITKFITGPLGRKAVERIAGKDINDPAKFICSGITALAANITIGEEWDKYSVYLRLYFQLQRLLRQFKNDEPDPLSLSLAFWQAGLTPYSQVDHKPLLAGGKKK